MKRGILKDLAVVYGIIAFILLPIFAGYGIGYMLLLQPTQTNFSIALIYLFVNVPMIVYIYNKYGS